MSTQPSLLVSILVFDAVEALDFAGPYEVFTTASRMYCREHPGDNALFEVACVSRDGRPVRARAGMRVLPDYSFEDCPSCDILIVPGGVVNAAMQCVDTRDWISRNAAKARITASVCTGAFLLANSAVIINEAVTTHWEDLAELAALFPALDVQSGPRWIDNGSVVTSAGISAGMDMSLHLVERLAGPLLANRTARQMDYRWCLDNGS